MTARTAASLPRGGSSLRAVAESANAKTTNVAFVIGFIAALGHHRISNQGDGSSGGNLSGHTLTVALPAFIMR
jgi:hypothetical protein